MPRLKQKHLGLVTFIYSRKRGNQLNRQMVAKKDGQLGLLPQLCEK